MNSLRFIPHDPLENTLASCNKKGQESKKTPTSLTWICDSLDAWKQVLNIFSPNGGGKNGAEYHGAICRESPN